MSDVLTPSWRGITDPDELVEAICGVYDAKGESRYDEAVTQTQHAIQAAELARDEGRSEALIVAALLHDLGHLLLDEFERRPDFLTRDLHHEDVAARFLANWFGPEVTEPIRLHVAAKRYLCTVEPGYHDGLSPASVRSLVLQGGPMTDSEAAVFGAGTGAAEAADLRRWDDLAKDPDRPVGAIRDYAPIMRGLVRFEA